MNFLSLSQRLRQECGGTGTGPASVSNQVGEDKQFVDWTNRAYREIQQDRTDWGWLWAQGSKSIGVGESLHSLLSSKIDTSSVRIDGGLIQYVPYQQWSYFTLSDGKPSAFTLTPARELKFNTLPDAVYTLTYDYYKNTQLMVNNTDVPLIPEEYHMLVVYKAMQYYGFYENAGEIIQSGVARYEDMLADLDRDTLPEMESPGPVA